jgi:lipid A 3-O-deacylase
LFLSTGKKIRSILESHIALFTVGFNGGHVHFTVTRWIIIFLLFVFSASPGNAVENKWNTAGIRAGISDQSSEKFFSKYEAFAAFSLPWKWRSEHGWILGTYVEINAGLVTSEGNAFEGSIGPGFYLMAPGGGFAIVAGIYPTYLGQSKFGTEDFGETFQFTSEIGFNLNFFRYWTVGYRFQHMSNAGIASENPGLNTHMLELGYRF